MPKRVDQNHRAIVRALRDVPGVTVFSLADLGRKAGTGVPDLCVGYRSFTILCEIKGPKGHLNPAQTEWHFQWTGTPVVILRTVDDVERLITTLNTYYHELGRTLAKAFSQEDHDRHAHHDKS